MIPLSAQRHETIHDAVWGCITNTRCVLFPRLSVHKNVRSIPETEPMLPIIDSRMFIYIHA